MTLQRGTLTIVSIRGRPCGKRARARRRGHLAKFGGRGGQRRAGMQSRGARGARGPRVGAPANLPFRTCHIAIMRHMATGRSAERERRRSAEEEKRFL